MKRTIKYRQGFSFSAPVIAIAVLISAVSLFYLNDQPILSPLAFIIGATIWTNSYGTEISLDKKKFREYGSVLFFRYGKWIALELYPNICVLQNNMAYNIYSRTNTTNTISFDNYDVCLLNENHRSRIVVQTFNYKIKAFEFASEFSKLLNKEIVQFSPKISEKTKLRRNRK